MANARSGGSGLLPQRLVFGLMYRIGFTPWDGHALPDADRDAYVRSVTAVAAPDARMLVAAFPKAGQKHPRGMDREEVEERFGNAGWEMVSAETEPGISSAPGAGVGIYELRRR